jgi:hypothetical protein
MSRSIGRGILAWTDGHIRRVAKYPYRLVFLILQGRDLSRRRLAMA